MADTHETTTSDEGAKDLGQSGHAVDPPSGDHPVNPAIPVQPPRQDIESLPKADPSKQPQGLRGV